MAKVNDHVLFVEEAEILMEKLGYNVNSEDDLKTFVETWTTAKMLADELNENNSDNAILSKYRKDLFEGELAQYYLVEEIIQGKIDTNVSENDLKNYYEIHADEFELNDFIVKALFIKVGKNSSKVNELKTAYLLKKDKDITKVESIAKLYAEDFYFDDENWVLLEDILSRFPMRSLNKESLVLNRTKTYISDEKFTYFLNIMDYRFKNDKAPFDFVKPQIKDRLLSMRKNDQRKSAETKLLKQLKEKHDIEVHI